jgi:hypothetical protein
MGQNQQRQSKIEEDNNQSNLECAKDAYSYDLVNKLKLKVDSIPNNLFYCLVEKENGPM